MWRVDYAVTSATGALIDAEIEVGLTNSQLSTVLSSITDLDVNYADMIFSGDLSSLLSYSGRFQLLFMTPVRQQDFTLIKAAILNLWRETHTSMKLLTCEFHHIC